MGADEQKYNQREFCPLTPFHAAPVDEGWVVKA
jgi:hypothetical protein